MSYHHRDCLVNQNGPCDCGIQEFLDDENVKRMKVMTDEGEQEIIVIGKAEPLEQILKERNT